MSQSKLPDNTTNSYYPTLKTSFQEITLRSQETHYAITNLSFQALQWIPGWAEPARLAQSAHDAITSSLYTAIRQSGNGLLEAAALLEPHIAATTTGAVPPSHANIALHNAPNTVADDHQVSNTNPLEIIMGFYASGHLIPLTVDGLHAYLPKLSDQLCLFIHDWECDEQSWQRSSAATADLTSQDYGRRLRTELGYTPLYLRYNTSLDIADNGRQLAQQLRLLLAIYPQPVRELVMVGHGIGGLVAHSACQQAIINNQPWLNLMRMVISLGTPQPSTLPEQRGHPRTATPPRSATPMPLGEPVNTHSTGIKNLRYGLRILDEPSKNPSAQPNIVLRSIDATPIQDAEHPLNPALGNRLVAFGSATVSALPGDLEAVRLEGISSMALLNNPQVYQQIKQWLSV